MSIVARYLLSEFLAASGTVFLALLVTWTAADTLIHLDVLSEEGGGGARLILFRSLELIPIGVPIACLAGIIWSLTRAVQAREITAIRCGGIPIQRALIPVLLACVGIGGALILFEDRVIVPTRGAILKTLSNGDATPEPTYMNGRWWYASGSSVFSAAEYTSEGNALRGVTVFKLDRDRHIERRIDAHEAVNLEGKRWEFRAAKVYVFEQDGGLAYEEKAHVELDLGVSGEDLSRSGAPTDVTTLHKLARRIRERGPLDPETAGLQTAFHVRLAQPLSVLVLVLLALPFALGSAEREDSLPRALMRSLIACAGFWLIWTLGVMTSHSGAVPPALPLWGLLLGFVALGGWRFRRISQ